MIRAGIRYLELFVLRNKGGVEKGSQISRSLEMDFRFNAVAMFFFFWVPVKCETKQKRNGTKRNRSKRNETNRNETKQIETKRNRSKRNETKRNEANRNETKQMILQDIVDKNRPFLCNDCTYRIHNLVL